MGYSRDSLDAENTSERWVNVRMANMISSNAPNLLTDSQYYHRAVVSESGFFISLHIYKGKIIGRVGSMGA